MTESGKPWWLDYLAVPCCGSTPIVSEASTDRDPATIQCPSCGAPYPVEDGIVRFAAGESYAESFGLQWDEFAETQVDHRNGTRISEERLRTISDGTLDFLRGKVVYDSGCGAGRYAAVAASAGARVIAAEITLGAVRACRNNTHDVGEVVCVHADPARPPVQDASVDAVLSVGVYQHTPDPRGYLRQVTRAVRPGGTMLLWGYENRLTSLLHPKWILRPVTRRMDPDTLLRLVKRSAPLLLRLSDGARRLPLGRYAARLVPVANYGGVLPLDERQRLEWAILDTFNWLSPPYVRPLKYEEVQAELESLGFTVTRTDPDAVGCLAERPALL